MIAYQAFYNNKRSSTGILPCWNLAANTKDEGIGLITWLYHHDVLNLAVKRRL
jgi:hypothetical protein